MQNYADDVRLAHVVADAADAATMPRSPVPRADAGKGRATFIAEADIADVEQAAEAAVRNALRRARPRDTVLGRGPDPAETLRAATPGAPGTPGTRCWVVQPLDGRDSFRRGVPVWATTLALLDGPEVVAALVSAPALNRRWWAGRGSGAWTGRSLSSATPCSVSGIADLGEASLSYGDLHSWVTHSRLGQFLELSRRCGRSRGYGDFWSYVLVADGGVDVALQPEGSLHDFAAASLLVEEAGGAFTDLEGRPGPAGGHALASNGQLHLKATAVMSSLRG